MSTKRAICNAAVLFLLAGSAMAQVDGKITNAAEAAKYGPPKWIQNVTTGFGDAGPSNPCDDNTLGGDPAAVRTGVEYKIPLASIGATTSSTVKVVAFINGGGHNYASNQFLPSLPAHTSNLGDGTGNYSGTLANLNLGNIAGNQSASLNIAALTQYTPTIDGSLDVTGANVSKYGPAIALQLNRTGFGKANNGLQSANGSEMDALYACADATNLYIFIAGNAEANFNRVELFIDSVAGGQNTISLTGSDFDGDTIAHLSGLTFEPGFDADYLFTFGCGGSNPTKYYPNFVDLQAQAGNYFIGCNTAGDGSGVLDECGSPPSTEIALDNSNTIGVGAPCPPPAGNADVANGSEIDAVYAYIEAGRLHVLVTGNIENGGGTACDPGGNKLNLFFDADGGSSGQNVMLANMLNNPQVVDISYGNLNRLGGMTFDSGFAADYWMSIKTGGSPVYQVMDCAVLRTSGMLKNGLGNPLDYGAYDGGTKSSYNPVTFRGNFVPCNGNASDPQPQSGFDPNLYTNYAPRAAAASLNPDPTNPVGTPDLIEFSINNGNFGGVQGTNGSVSDAGNVTTGTEISIDLTELGWDGHSCIKLAGFIANGDTTYGSNQVIGGLPSQNYANLGSVGPMSAIDFNTIDGQQWVTIIDGDSCSTCPVCAADYDNNGGIDGGDVAAFFVDWESGTGCADVNQDGGIDGQDVGFFFMRWEAGGC